MRFYKCYQCFFFFNCLEIAESYLYSRNRIGSFKFYNDDFNNFELSKFYTNKLDTCQECKTILYQPAGVGVLSTLGNGETQCYPQGTVVGYSMDHDGLPFFVFTDLSIHTINLLENNSASLCVMEYGFNNILDSRVMLTGDVRAIDDKLIKDKYKNMYLDSHPNEEWIRYESSYVFKMNKLVNMNLVCGLGNEKKVNIRDYLKSNPDVFIHNIEQNIDYINDNYYSLLGVILIKKFNNLISFQIKSVDCHGINLYIKLSNCRDKLFFRIYFDNRVNNLFDIEDELKKIDI